MVLVQYPVLKSIRKVAANINRPYETVRDFLHRVDARLSIHNAKRTGRPPSLNRAQKRYIQRCNRMVLISFFIFRSVTIGMIILLIFRSWLSFVDDYKLVFVFLTNSLHDRFQIIDFYISKTTLNLSACLHEFVR